jgi:hypothetical protein
MPPFIGAIVAGFLLTVMTQQVFPDGRFPATTSILVGLLASLSALITRVYFAGATIFTPEFVGAGLVSLVLFAIFHRTGWLAQDVPPSENKEDSEK